MKKILFSIAGSLIIFASVSCNKESFNVSNNGNLVFTASIDNSLITKTTLTSERKVNWDAGDEININGAVYVATPKTDATKADFTKVSGADPTGQYKAIFPSSLYVTDHFELPATQTYSAGKFNAPMYAESNTESLSFKNIFGVLSITLDPTDFTKIYSIRVSSANHAMSGAFSINKDNIAVFLEPNNTSAIAILDCGDEGISIPESGTTFYITVPASDYDGLKIEVSDDGKTYKEAMITKKGITTHTNTIYSIQYCSNAVRLEDNRPYWSTCNVGATKAEDFGCYYAWGEVVDKTNFSWKTYSLCKGGDYFSLIKYCTDSYYSATKRDMKTVLELEDDVAHVKWGGTWRMPTFDEIERLKNCDWKNITLNDVAGYVVTSRQPGYENKSIFFPEAGCSTSNGGCYLWSSSLYQVSNWQAGVFYYIGSAQTGFIDRATGCSVRPVSE